MPFNPLPTLEALSGCLCQAIAAEVAGGPPTVDPDPAADVCWCGVLAGTGEPPADMVGEGADGTCGIAYVQLALGYPSDQVGVQTAAPAHIPTGFGMDLNVGILRTIELSAENPDPAEMLGYADRQFKDMDLIRNAILCCEAVPRSDMILGTYQPYGPVGDVLGGYWTVHVGTL